MRIRASIELGLPAARIFALLHDYDQRVRWDTFVPNAVLLDATVPGPGVTVRCTDKLGLRMDTRYVAFRPPYLATVRMVQGPWPFRQLAGSWRIVEQTPDHCTLLVTYNLKTRPGAIRPIVEPLVTALFWLQTWRRLRALARYVGTLHQ